MNINTSPRPHWGAAAWLALIVIPIPIFLYLCHIYYPFFADDAFISLRYSDRLLEGKGLTWNDGERVEGYSNLLWVLLTALPGLFGVDLVDAGRAACALGTAATAGALLYFAYRRSMPWLVTLVGMLFLATSRPVAIWSVGGLESTLHMALITWIAAIGWLQFHDKIPHPRWLLPTLMGLTAINRPDGIIFDGLFSVLFLLAATSHSTPRTNRREAMIVALLALILPALQLLFRIVYYHDIFPNTFYAKVALSERRLREGIDYVLTGAHIFMPVIAATATFIIIGLQAHTKDIRTTLFLLAPMGMWMAAVATAGGDIFPAYRHLLPIVGVLGLLLMTSMTAALTVNRGLVIVIACMGLYFFNIYQLNESQIDRARLEMWEWNNKEVGERLRAMFAGEEPLIAVHTAGATPFYSKLPTLDMFGLNDPYMTKHKPKDFGNGRLAHELFSPEYVISRKPDVVIFDGSATPEQIEQFRPAYVERWMDFSWGRLRLWVRKDSNYINKFPETPAQ